MLTTNTQLQPMPRTPPTRLITGWQLACRSITFDRMHLLAACLVPLSYSARIRAEYMYLLVYHILKDYKSVMVTRIIRTLFVTHAAAAVPVVLGRLIGQRVLLVGACLAYMCVWGERLLSEHVVPLLPTSLRKLIERQSSIDGALELCFVLLWGVWIGAHVNDSYFDWLLASQYFSPTKLMSSFVMSFNSSFSSSLMMYLLYDHDLLTRHFLELVDDLIVAGDASATRRALVLMWTCAIFGFLLYEHIWPFTWAWQLMMKTWDVLWDFVLEALLDVVLNIFARIAFFFFSVVMESLMS
jgi:hypothetical protein